MAEIDFGKLTGPFDMDDLEWRVQSCGKNAKGIWARIVPYVTCRAIMERLDQVAGPGNWKNRFESGPGTGMLCGIALRIEGEWIEKWDGADKTDIEEVKGVLSSAMKRAAVQWGIGRYLYSVEPVFAHVCEGGKRYGKLKDGTLFHWDLPEGKEREAGGGKREEAGGEQGLETVEFLNLVQAREQIEKTKNPQELFGWMNKNLYRLLRPVKAEIMECFNARLRELKAAA